MNFARFPRLAVFFVVAALSLPSIAGPSEDADAAYKSDDYATALRLWRDLAEQGDASAQTSLGRLYRDGRGVSADQAEAVKWFRKAVEQGFANAQVSLGYMYANGRGVGKDDIEAVQWYRKAAEQGNALGQTNLGYMYANGRGVGKDDIEAVRWYRKAAEQGNALGQNNLGVMYRDGRGVAKDDALAVTWFRKAAEQGNALGHKNLAAMHEQGRGDARSDAEAITPPIPANTSIVRGAEFDVGRVTLRLPDDAWESIGMSRRGLSYTGDRSGEIPLVSRHLLLRDSAGKFRAVLVVRASWGVGTVRMTWTQSCRPQQNTHVVDNTRGDVNGRDCLRVTGPIATQRYLELAAPELLAELTGRSVALPRTGYAVSDEVGLENGTYLSVQAVFAADFKLPTDTSSQNSFPAGVKPEAVAWGAHLAEAVSGSVHSPSGTLILPPVAGKAANQ
jgi:hypothetical protein